jgi:hypothetical protein
MVCIRNAAGSQIFTFNVFQILDYSINVLGKKIFMSSSNTMPKEVLLLAWFFKDIVSFLLADIILFIYLFFAMLEIRARVFHMPGKCSTIELAFIILNMMNN